MKVQTRLSLFCSIVFGVIFAILSLLIYGLFYKNTQKQVYSNLQKTAYITAIFYLEEDELNSKEFEKVRNQFESLVSDASYQIYNEVNQVSYGVQQSIVPSEILDEIRQKGSLTFSTENFRCYGIFYEDNQGDFVVIAKNNKDDFSAQMNLLLWILLASFIIGLFAIIALSMWVSRVAYRPFQKVIDQVNNISTNNLNVQIESPNTKDELQDLINTFNNLLSKISESFVIQKNFVRYVSHEFKTPLASVLGNLEVFSIKDRSPEEYQKLSEKLIQEILHLENILNTLIVVSDLSKDSNIASVVRIDELIWEIIHKISEHSHSKMKVNLDVLPNDEHLLFIDKDRTQLFMALYNLIENAVKYSQGRMVDINIFKTEKGTLCLSIKDHGIGIPPEQLEHISKPFYRADNADHLQGSGIGLSIALRILEKNKIKYTINSEINEGTKIVLFLNSNQ